MPGWRGVQAEDLPKEKCPAREGAIPIARPHRVSEVMEVERVGDKNVLLSANDTSSKDLLLRSSKKHDSTRWVDFQAHLSDDGTVVPFLAHYT
jgi:hypothetical protein